MKLSTIFSLLAILLTNVMCIVVTFNCTALYSNPLNSAPWNVGLLYIIPFAPAIILCAIVAHIAKKRGR